MASNDPFGELCCVARATLMNLCVSDDDLLELGVWDEAPHASGYSAAVRGRAALHGLTRSDPELARRLHDRLDLAYLDTVMTVRALDDAQLGETVDAFVERPDADGRALPALLWALCTDDRVNARSLGVQLCHEALTLACRRLAHTPVPADSGGADA